eukprot:365057-Chlamydomonas_euryale.AAC.13
MLTPHPHPSHPMFTPHVHTLAFPLNPPRHEELRDVLERLEVVDAVAAQHRFSGLHNGGLNVACVGRPGCGCWGVELQVWRWTGVAAAQLQVWRWASVAVAQQRQRSRQENIQRLQARNTRSGCRVWVEDVGIQFVAGCTSMAPLRCGSSPCLGSGPTYWLF